MPKKKLCGSCHLREVVGKFRMGPGVHVSLCEECSIGLEDVSIEARIERQRVKLTVILLVVMTIYILVLAVIVAPSPELIW